MKSAAMRKAEGVNRFKSAIYSGQVDDITW